ncbi:MAG: AAA family ATPase [Eubacterium sp.]|nr:AAA family ATPase [Eubacterium sp.]
MDENVLRKELAELEQKVAELPVGYISKKTIAGKVRYYLQWTENGKKKSKYVDEAVVGTLRSQIEERRQLQARIKEIKALLPNVAVKPEQSANEQKFQTNVIVGDRLRSFFESVAGYKKRACFSALQDYLYGDVRDKVFILYGLRRTGKTTLIRQALAEMSGSELVKSAFIQIGAGNNLSQVNADLKLLSDNGFKYIFIDEVTLMEDFIEGAALFSDVFAACGMKIVLSGTDSLGFLFSEDEQLYDRCILLHTTFIPYKEFEEVLGVKGIDEYIRYGGTMSLGGVHYNKSSTFASAKSTDEYVDSAIARNIQHSLKCYQYAGHFRALQDLYEHGELTSAINRIIEDINHRFTLDVLTRDFISHDLGLSARNLRNDRETPNDILDRIDIQQFTERLKSLLEIKNRNEMSVNITEVHKKEIKEYLDLLDLTVDIDIQSLPPTNLKNQRTLFSQPGMRYCQAEELIKSLMLDATFQKISAVERSWIIERILDEIKGRMMEDIVLLEMKMNSNKQVFKLQFAVGEFDMIVVDPETNTCEIYEIKHSTERTPEQYKNLIDESKFRDTEFRHGRIVGKYVIYRGESSSLNGIEYLNVEEYLKSL